ncbi:MAG: 5-formyltetrahydrofolate cyclo-ligase [Buchnera aphidicola (Meitanaphis flavogallis)]
MLFINRNIQREYFRKLRKNVMLKEKIIASINISNLAFYCERLRIAKNVAIFFSFDGEIDTHALILKLWKKKYNVFLPIIDSICDKKLLFSQYFPNTCLKLNVFNIFEPILNKNMVLSCNDMDVIFVPLVTFDKFGYRLGMGGGFYDKILSNWKKKGFFPIGLAYNFQLVDKIIPFPWEFSLPLVLTPNKLWIWKC